MSAARSGATLDLGDGGRRDVFAAFATLTAILVGHSMLEAARDALFLASLPAARLPWVYLAIAALTFVVIAANEEALARAPKRRTLAATLALAGLCTAGFWLWGRRGGTAPLYAFYVWTGLVATIAVSQLWILLAERFDVGRAKRAYAIIGAGGLIGATAGSGLARLLLAAIEPVDLVLCAAAIMVLGASVPLTMSARVDQPPQARKRRRRAPAVVPEHGDGLRAIAADPYLRRLLVLILVTTITVTAADLTFKTVVAERVAADRLGEFFASFYAVVNGLALVVQVLLSSRLLQALGVNRSLWVLPALLAIAAGSFVATAALVSVLLLKGFDGTLRHSLNRTATELLYLPIPGERRGKAKALIDGVGSRGGQALAALAILVAVGLGAEPLHLAAAVMVAAALWVLCVVGLERFYLALFREQLREGSIETRLAVPALDLRSLEALMAALNDPDPRIVVNALELLVQSGRTSVIPALILYHPDREVVLRALELLAASNRRDHLPIARRLVHAVDPAVRVAAVRAVSAASLDAELLRGALEDANADVRAVAMVALASAGEFDEREAEALVEEVIAGASTDSRVALARAIGRQPNGHLDAALRKLARSDETEVLAEVASAVAERPNPSFLPALIAMLEHRACRPAARRALLAIGQPALDVLDDALGDPGVSLRLRRHIPRTLSKFPPGRASPILLAHLQREGDPRIAYKILRGLGRMVADDPTVKLDREALTAVALRTVERAARLLGWRLALTRAWDGGELARTEGAAVLEALLAQNQARAIERAFRLLGILEPREDFRIIHAGLSSDDGKTRASSLELLEHLVEAPLRGPLLALLRPGPEASRLEEARAQLRMGEVALSPALRAMLRDPSEAIRSLTAHYVGEARLSELIEDVRAVADDERGMIAEVIDDAVAVLRGEGRMIGAT